MLLAEPLGSMGVRDGDVVSVTQKIVSKAEGVSSRRATVGRRGSSERPCGWWPVEATW